MKLISWNVNGIRSAIDKGLTEFISASDPDIICMQETKALPEQVELNLPGYQQFWNPAIRKGYSGTVTFSKSEPIDVTRGMDIAKHDEEGRLLTLEYEKLFVVNAYAPNAKRNLERLSYRIQEWEVDFLVYLKNLERTKPVVFCGDLNVAHREIDLANPKANKKNAGFTPEERAAFQNILDSGFVDTFREFEKGGGHYTWWRQMHNARQRNLGWRIDYVCISRELRKDLRDAFILPSVMGSDHCPVGIILIK